ncbi:hypothetical protein, partial [Leptospira noguchii]|uniref:hypothetical protein n=1 Tax=Leptospira noguchii TaxID=28182 RepID=UPI001F27866B
LTLALGIMTGVQVMNSLIFSSLSTAFLELFYSDCQESPFLLSRWSPFVFLSGVQTPCKGGARDVRSGRFRGANRAQKGAK